MNEKFIRERITELRIAAKKSEREMSLDMGHSGSYINGIASGRIVPSLGEFLYICEYLQVTPEEFFHSENTLSMIKRKAIGQITQMDDKTVALLSNFIDRLQNPDKQKEAAAK